MPTYYVRCTATSTLTYKAFVFDSNSKPIPDVLVETSPTTIELVPDYVNSAPTMKNFSLHVAPKNNNGDITVNQVSPTDIRVDDSCKKQTADDIALCLTVRQDGSSYATDSGKPIIRNSPAQKPVQWVLVVTMVVIAIAAVIAIAHYGFGVDFGFGRAP